MIKEKFNANRKTDRQTDRRIDGQKEQRDKKNMPPNFGRIKKQYFLNLLLSYIFKYFLILASQAFFDKLFLTLCLISFLTLAI